ncbi:SET domain-containing protein [Mytilinidion resinicola]|uniref:SET domain-containing protein n=1 Tax=Mytilinidion resinicola TaxID=574789 RepID=A0A6A6YGM0_9PEZI|nr:SET domain-containing protein [Mytilinidion resinicola]KAF2807047.1 SET domain-containing protein [Mytilinidion resinicola]
MGVTASLPMYAVEDVPGKGKGLIATKDIPKGTRIISEKPIIASGRHVADMEQLQIRICQQVSSLSEGQQREFFSMDNIYPYTNSTERWRGIFRTNALRIGPVLDEEGIFFKACRINHACDNNAQNFWNENLNQLTIHAVRDIRKGEEITISYLGSRRNRRARQEELWENFKFTCSCRLCSLPPDQSRDSDSKLDRIHELDCIIDQGGVPGLVSSARRMLSYIDEQVRLWNELTPNEVSLARAYPDAFQIAIANGDLARGRIFAERLVPLYLTTIGDDSPEVIQYSKLVRDPATHDYYGMSMKWKTTLDEVPQGLGPKEFEDWLWKRRKETAQGQLAGLRDPETFPSFDDLPDERDFESKYFECRDMANRRPVRHWCFLAEIRDFDFFVRLHMTVKDSQIQKGYTVAILYAVRHAFMSCEPGIRHENPQMMKIFPLSLDRLQNLSENVQKFSTELDGVRICHGCGKKGTSLKQCGKCSSFWYCNRVCQKADWIEKGHKAECKVLKDPDWRAMLHRKWDEFNGHVHFPLRIGESS